MNSRRRIPLALKIFAGFVLVLLLFYLGNIIFYYQFSKVSELNAESAATFFRMSQEKKLIDQLDDLENNLNLLSTSNVGNTGNEREALDEFLAEMELMRSKAPDSKISEYLRNDIAELGRIKDDFWGNLENNDISNARRLIDERLGTSTITDLKSKMRRVSGLEDYIDRLHQIEGLMKQAYRLKRIRQIKLEIGAIWSSIKEQADSDLRGSEAFEIADGMVKRLSVSSVRSDEHGLPDIQPLIKQIGLLRENLSELSSIDQLLMTQILDESTERYNNTGRLVLYVSIVTALFSLIVAIFLARKIAEPIQTLRKATYRASLGKYDQKLEITTRDEVGGLVEDFNSMMDALGRLDEMKSHFMASVTHDLKSPLNRIKQRMANVEDGIYGDPPQWLYQQLENVFNDVETLQNLVHNHLDLQKIEIGKFTLEKESTPVKAFVRSTVEKHVVSFQAKGVGLYLKLNFPEHEVLIDREHMVRVIDNLLTNALKYSTRGETVSVLGRRKQSYIEIDVADQGPGIDDERKPYIFDRFYQVPGTKVKGTGLGLTITKEIIEAHGGRIEVRDNEVKGTVFTITLPDTPEIV